PLAAMLGWVGVLRQGALSPERAAAALQTIERSGRLQAALIDDLLDLSRIITGQLRLRMTPTSLAEVVTAAVESVRPAAIETGLTPSVPRGGDAPSLGDEPPPKQTVANTLSNAVKSTPSGGRVEVALERAGGEAPVRVRDTGRGISPAFLPQVFEPFRQ